MQFTTVFVTLAAFATAACATSIPEVERRTPVGSPGSLLNCPPGGTADKCTLEVPVSSCFFSHLPPHKLKRPHLFLVQPNQDQLRSERKRSFHLVIHNAMSSQSISQMVLPCRYNFDINNIPNGIQVGTEQSCSDA